MEASDFMRRVRFFGRAPNAIAEFWKTRNVRVPDGCSCLHNRNAKLRNKTLVVFERGGGTRKELEGMIMAQLGRGPWNPSPNGIRQPGKTDLTTVDAQPSNPIGPKVITTSMESEESRSEMRRRAMAANRREDEVERMKKDLAEQEMKLEGERKGLELTAEACQREGDWKEEAGEWNREVSTSQVRYESDKPAERTEGCDQWEPNYSY